MAAVPSIETGADVPHAHAAAEKPSVLTPPHSSEDLDRHDVSSELSELDMEDLKTDDDDDDDDIGEIEPAYYYDGGKIPVFEPTPHQFRSFPKFIEKVDKYGMKAGIIKVVPPKEWRDQLQQLDEAVKTIRVKNPIMQEFVSNNGNFGAYTQQNIEKQRSYNLPQWKAVTEENQPPARRGERRKNAQPPKPKAPRLASTPNGERRRPGRPRKNAYNDESKYEDNADDQSAQVPPTPTSPDEAAAAGEHENDEQAAETPAKTRAKAGRPKGRRSSPKPRGRQPKATTVAERRKYNTTDFADEVDEESFEDFDYRFPEAKEFDKERCEALEEIYWKTLTYGTPMYGADMPGSLFSDQTKSWHVGRLENLLDVLGTKVPGVNTTYLYLGMWKATFAWHLEDVDLYSINYIHFGAPKQWYSISQEDARRFEQAMKQLWPMDAKHCDQFLRHKTYLISPDKLMKEFGIKANKLVHNEGEFVITYPYGYHSGYNLGYNCAESVNFATESWLNFGRIAKKCNCEADSVWVDVGEIERKLRGEPTPEWIEETDDEDEEDHMPTPPPSVAGKRGRPPKGKKKDVPSKAVQGKVKKTVRRIAIKKVVKVPCVLCPNEVSYDQLLPTDNGLMAHRTCAQYTPETYISEVDGKEMVLNVNGMHKSRLDLKCIYCRSKKGACFQCSEKKCTRAYHATCALAAGVLVDEGRMPTWDEEGTEFWYFGYDFRCRFHRPRRPKHWNLEHVEKLELPMDYAKALKPGAIVQAQYFGSEVFGGIVVENRPGEQALVMDVQPDGDRVEVEWKWLLVLDPAESKRPKPSPDAKPLPEKENLHNNDAFNASNRKDGVPDIGDVFVTINEGEDCKWAEWNAVNYLECRNPAVRLKVDILSKPNQLWHYLGKTSTEAKAQYTHDVSKKVHNPKSNFLDLVQPAAKANVVADKRSLAATYPGANYHATNAAMVTQRQAQTPHQTIRMDKPYQYRPKPELQAKAQPSRLAMDVKAIMNNSPISPQVPHYYTDGRRPSAGSPPNVHGAHAGSPPYGRLPAPKAFQQPPTPQTIAKDPLKAGYPYQSMTYTQVHGPRSPHDQSAWARRRSPSMASMRPTSQHSQRAMHAHHHHSPQPGQAGGAAPTANMAPVARMSSSSSSSAAAAAAAAATAPSFRATSSGSRPSSGGQNRPSPYALDSDYTKEYMPKPAAPPAGSTGYSPSPYSSGAATGPAPTVPRMGASLSSSSYPAYSPPQPSRRSSQSLLLHGAGNGPFAVGVPFPPARHQSPSAFQQSVQLEGSSRPTAGLDNQLLEFQRRISQLPAAVNAASGPASSSASSAAAPSTTTALGSSFASPNGANGATVVPERSLTTTPPPPPTGNKEANGGGGPAAFAGAGANSPPVRPEYSPLTDAGDASPRKLDGGVALQPLDVVAVPMDWQRC